MVPSPRKHAPPTTTPGFNQTWDDNDAAFLDPNSLPLSKIPRGWERKQEVKRGGEGKEKKIWRRFNLRSRAATTTEDDDEEEHDSRSRAVKKLQRMSPKAMEKTTAGLNGRRRTFRATRWDRRKSVLPRKKTARTEDSLVDTEIRNENADEDAQDATERNSESFTESTVVGEQPVELIHNLLPESNDRKPTSTFTVDAVEDLPDYESLDGQETERHPGFSSVEDATLPNLFCSHANKAPLGYIGSPEKIEYPDLPNSDDEELGAEIVIEPTATTRGVPQDVEHNIKTGVVIDNVKSQDDAQEQPDEAVEVGTSSEDREDLRTTSTPSISIAYPTLPIEVVEASIPSPPPEDSNDQREDVDMSETFLDLYANDELQEEDDPNADSVTSDEEEASEEFTEASLQLNIQREYEEALEAEQPTIMEDQEPLVEAEHETRGEQVIPETDAFIEHELCSVEDMAAFQAKEPEVGPSEHLQTPPSASKIIEATQLNLSAPSQHSDSVETQLDDVADGLSLTFTPAKTLPFDPTPQKFHSPPPPPRVDSGPDDVTMTMAVDDDTAILKDFLNRAAASKAEKAAIVTHRRESVQNRRDSDVVRHALASPRKVLEDKDPNSPSKYDNELTLDLSQTLTLSMPIDALESPTPDQAYLEGTEEERSLQGSRRSSRTKKSRLPAPASAAQTQTSKIAIRRADGNDVVILKKNDAQELATLTRANTRKNKQGAFGVIVRLLKLAADAASLPPVDDSTKELVVGKNIRWDEQLAYYQENPETVANLLADAESLATPDELSMPDASSAPKAKNKISKNSTPKIRRVRGLGTANGTPGKGLLAPASLLPAAVQEEKDSAHAPTQQLPRPKVGKIKKMPIASTSVEGALSSHPADTKLPTLDIAPVGVHPTTQRKSRLAAPKKVILPQPTTSLPSEGKENTQRPGISDATPKKGIPAPKVMVPSIVGVESGLPRRRGRKY